MPVDDVAPRFRELGRLKFGEDLGDRPAQLHTWRLTSPHRDLIEAAAEAYGGIPSATDTGHQVTTNTAALDVLVPPQDLTAGQFYELWTAGGLQRRCTGSALVELDDTEPDGFRRVAPCLCDEENAARRACKITTVLRVLLPQLPDLGVWRLVTRSGYAAAELPPAVAAVMAYTGPGGLAAAVLGLEARSTKRPGEPRKDYVVPVVRTRSTLAQLASGHPSQPESLPGLGAEAAATVDGLTPRAHSTSADGRPASTAQIGPQAPQIRPESDRAAPEGPEAGSERYRRFEPLAAFLAESDAAQLPQAAESLVEVLTQLERRMVAAGLWDERSLAASAERHLAGQDWRDPGAVLTPRLRTFTQLAFIAATSALESHPDGYQAARNYERSRS